MEINKVGLFIQECRKKQNMTQSDLATALHVSVQAVSKWERGLNYPDISLLSDLAALLKISVTELLQGELSVAEIKPDDAVKDVLDYSNTVIKKEKQLFNRKIMMMRLFIALIISAILAYTYDQSHPRYTVQPLTPSALVTMNKVYHGLEFLSDWTYCGKTDEPQIMTLHQSTLFEVKKPIEGFQIRFDSTDASVKNVCPVNLELTFHETDKLLRPSTQGGTLLWTDQDQYPEQSFLKGIPYHYPVVRGAYDQPAIHYWIYDLNNGSDSKTLKLYARFSAVYDNFRTDGQPVMINGTTAIITVEASELKDGKRVVPESYRLSLEAGLVDLMMQVGDSVLLSDIMDVNAHQFEYEYRTKISEYPFTETRSTVYDSALGGLIYKQTFTAEDGTVTFNYGSKGKVLDVELTHNPSTQSVTSILNSLNLLISNDLEIWPVPTTLLDKVKAKIQSTEPWIIEDEVTVVCIKTWEKYRISWPLDHQLD